MGCVERVQELQWVSKDQEQRESMARSSPCGLEIRRIGRGAACTRIRVMGGGPVYPWNSASVHVSGSSQSSGIGSSSAVSDFLTRELLRKLRRRNY